MVAALGGLNFSEGVACSGAEKCQGGKERLLWCRQLRIFLVISSVPAGQEKGGQGRPPALVPSNCEVVELLR